MSWLSRRKRRFDRWVYRRLHGIYRAIFPTRVPTGPLDASLVRRVLIARTDRVGDMVVLGPALAYLRQILPEAQIDLVASPASASLLAGDERIDGVYVYRPGVLRWCRAIRSLRARHYDAVFTLRLRDHLYEGIFAALIAGQSGARISARRPTQYVGLFTHSARVPHSRRHIRDRLLHVVGTAVVPDESARGSDVSLDAHVDGEVESPLVVDAMAELRADALVASWDGHRFVAFNAWGSDPRRCFGIARAVEIAATLAARHPGLVVVLTPSPAAAMEAEEIARLATLVLRRRVGGEGPDARIIASPVSAHLHDLVSLLRRADAVISPDTANVHIASALGTPVVAVYTDVTDASVWGAWGPVRREIHLPPGQLTADVSADAVADAFDALWRPELPRYVDRSRGPVVDV
jgi:heptosyltransferase III